MKTRDLAATLTTFAKLTEVGQADGLRKLAHVFSGGKEETVAARLKKMSPATGYPAALRVSLETIKAGFTAAGATKQATAVGTLLAAFVGPSDATVDTFVAHITAPLPAPTRKKAPPEPDQKLARELADDLARTALDTGAFKDVVKRLRVAKLVNTPTLAIVASRFLGNSKQYTGRKEAIDDIVNRQKEDARERARGRALSRIGV